LVGIGVGNQQHRNAADQANGSPSIFAIFHPILVHQREWVGEHKPRRSEAHAMLSLIGSSFAVVPFEPERHGEM
jgi:hypothetical protein